MRAPSPPARQVPSSSIQKPWSHVRGDGRFVALRLVVEDRRHRDLAGDGGGRRRRLIEKVAMDLALLVLFDVTRRRDPELEARDSGEGLLQPFEVRPRERQREGADVVVDDERDVVRLAGAFALRPRRPFPLAEMDRTEALLEEVRELARERAALRDREADVDHGSAGAVLDRLPARARARIFGRSGPKPVV